MRHPKPLNAGIISMILALVFLVGIYAVCGRVDLIFKLDGEELCRQENVCSLSAINDPTNSIPKGIVEDGEEIKFYFADGEENVVFTPGSMRLKVVIAKTIITNLVTFKWGESSQFVILEGVILDKI